MPSPSITPQGSSTFERIAHRLGLAPSEYARSRKLKEWARKNKPQVRTFVPSRGVALSRERRTFWKDSEGLQTRRLRLWSSELPRWNTRIRA